MAVAGEEAVAVAALRSTTAEPVVVAATTAEAVAVAALRSTTAEEGEKAPVAVPSSAGSNTGTLPRSSSWAL